METKMNENNLIALVDMDGTIADYDGQLTKDLQLLASPGEVVYLPWDELNEYTPHLRARINLIKSHGSW